MMINRRTFLAICLLPLAFLLSSAWAQGTVVDSIDEDIVEEEALVPSAGKVPAPADSAAAEKKKKKKELDLDALLAGDDGDDLFKDDKPVVKKPAAAGADSALVSDTSSSASAKAKGELAADSAARSAGGPAKGSAKPPVSKASAAKADPADSGPAVIEDGRTINFAQNLKEYRSPRIAMLLSLLAPGLGQAYARSYIKAGAFGAAELTAIGVAVYFNWKGNRQRDDAYRFADEKFDTTRLKAYDERLRREIKDRDIDVDKIVDITMPYDFYNKEFYDAARDKSTFFYESIRGGYFIPGWEDFDPGIDGVFSLTATDTITGKYGRYALNAPDAPDNAFFYLLTRVADEAGNRISEGPILGYSSDQARYNSMLDKSKSYYDAVNYTVYVLLLNHIASAIDAGFTARAYNARLLGQESAWGRVSVEQQFVFTGSEVSPGLALRMRF